MKITIAGKDFFIQHIHDGAELFQKLVQERPKFFTYDTETSGLHVKADKPFKGGICFKNQVFLFDTSYDILKWWSKWCNEVKKVVMHNAPFDLNMTANIIGEDEALKTNNFTDTQASVLLTTESISESRGGIILKLKKLAVDYIDPNANKWELALKQYLKQLKSDQNKLLTAYIKGITKPDQEIELGKNGKPKKPKTFTRKEFDTILDAGELESYPELFEMYEAWKEENPEPTYDDVPPEILDPYLAVDVILTALLYEKTAPIVIERKQEKALQIEDDIIPVTVRMGRVGMDVDHDYLEESGRKLEAEINRKYEELWSLTKPLGFKFNSGQHPTVKKYFAAKGYDLESTDSDHLEDVPEREAELIIKLRTLEKWLSTYVRKIQKDTEWDGRFYSMLKPFKAVSGRFSGDSQQFPKFPLKDDNGDVLYHPRRAFKGEWVFQD